LYGREKAADGSTCRELNSLWLSFVKGARS
jgi:hypothetical protein